MTDKFNCIIYGPILDYSILIYKYMKKCNECGEEFSNNSLYANHIRWKHKNNDEFKKKISKKSIITNEKMYGKWIYEKVNCFICDDVIDIRYRECKKKEKYYCSIKCANKRTHSKETKDKISKSVSELWKSDDYRNNIMKYVGKNQRCSSKGERDLRYKLKCIYGDNVKYQYLIKTNEMTRSVDIFIPEKNVIIEYDGIWHFKQVMNEHNFNGTLKKDKFTKEYCKNNKIKLIRISDDVYNNDRNKYLEVIIDNINNDKKYIEIYK